MPGLSGAAKVAKKAATSPTTRNAVKKAATSNIVKSTVSSVVLDGAVPAVKERVQNRLTPDESDADSAPDEERTADKLGEWYEASFVDTNNPSYEQYLRAQLRVLGHFENHIESYDDPGFENHLDSFHNHCENPDLQAKSAKILIESLTEFINHLENYGVRNDEFRSYVVEAPADVEISGSVDLNGLNQRERVRVLHEHLESCNTHLRYLLEYTEQDSDFQSYVESFGRFFRGSLRELEISILAEVQYLSYLHEYTTEEQELKAHVERFSPKSESYTDLLEAENQLLKDVNEGS